MRNKMAHLIVTHMLQNSSDQKLSTCELKNMSIEIVKLFPNDIVQTYFIPYKKEDSKITPNRGKLWDKYCNIRKYTRQIALHNKPIINIPTTVVSGVLNDEGTFLTLFLKLLVICK